mmetsp:Transcript_66834/g.175223  ORF Transcript_66834/g.175223 Transcript_66834/m.175223 type:complete len:288 (+) Transcript_66834:224-1087(+)
MVFGRLFRSGEADPAEAAPREQRGQSKDEALVAKLAEDDEAAVASADEEAAMQSAEQSTSDFEELKEDREDWDEWDIVEPPADPAVEVNDDWIDMKDVEGPGAPSAKIEGPPPPAAAGENAAGDSPVRRAGGDDGDAGASSLPPCGGASASDDGSGSTVGGQAALSDASGCDSTDDERIFSCLMCRSPIFKADDIVSSNYHAQTSPGYLLGAARSISISSELQTATYTTGQYTIQEVMCQRCSATLGVTYSAAAEPSNQYKVGKFLVGRDRLQLPPGVVHPMDKAKA